MRRTKPQTVNPAHVKQFVADADRRILAARKNLAIDSETAYQIAYEGMIKASLALMLSQGERPRKQLGHHIAIIDFAEAHLTQADSRFFALFDRMRRKRNDAFYGIALISDSEATQAVITAESYVAAVKTDIRRRIS